MIRYFDMDTLADASRDVRLEVFKRAAEALDDDDLDQAIAGLIARHQAKQTQSTSAKRPAKKGVAPKAGETATAKAIAYVKAHPNGCTTKEVSEHIGQPPKIAGSTLRQIVSKKKGEIERRDDKWFPVVQSDAKAPKQMTADFSQPRNGVTNVR